VLRSGRGFEAACAVGRFGVAFGPSEGVGAWIAGGQALPTVAASGPDRV